MAEENRRGRPRAAGTDLAILRAARELLVERGYARLSMEGVAARAGVGKPTVYRRWPSKGALVADAVRSVPVPQDADPGAGPADTGDVEADLRGWLRAVAAVTTAPDHAALVLALTAAAAENPDDAASLYRRLSGPQHEALVARLRAGADAGQLRPDADLEAVADALTGALLYQLLTGNAAQAERRSSALLDTLLTGIRTAPPP
ncbi:TetR/AcrR family transcriptional regulator [Streptomyces sp. NPDC049879]|uniref:TetR/AcrR family transcriptional regulator n=1 Tax=Streptomyces sp. NPDC049879 TaxID=3365598 RepID=UPI0037B3316A